MAKTIDQLLAERESLDAKIKRLRGIEKERKLKTALTALQALGLLDLPEDELLAKLNAAAAKPEQESLESRGADA